MSADRRPGPGSGGGHDAVDVLRRLRVRWAARGVELVREDPTDRSGAGWVAVADLADPDRARAAAADYGAAHGIADPKAAASLLGKRLGSVLAFPATVAWMAERHVPDLSPDRTWLRFVDGTPTTFAVAEPRGWASPERAGAGVEAVDDPARLRARLLDVDYDAAVGPLLDALATAVRMGRRHLWGNLALVAVNSAIWVPEAPDPWGDADALLAERPDLARTLDVRDAHDDRVGPFRVALRRTCCMAYADPDHGYCASCSLVDHDERLARLPGQLADAIAAAPRVG
ncbi:MAG TPA: (2Fe-2S)-binding protein [Acidimicrobiales bacterium]|nr:(2Fe-2S)-binding protein [Acidimicrobiales bacterium]